MNIKIKFCIFFIALGIFAPVSIYAEQKPRWVSKGVKELDKERTNNTYSFHIFHSVDADRRSFQYNRFKPLINYVDSTYNEARGGIMIDSIPATPASPVTYTLTFNRDGLPCTVYAQEVDSYTKFDDYADGYYEYNQWQLYAISEPGVKPEFDKFTLSTKYNAAPAAMSLIPGLGQIYKGQKAKGYTIMGTEALLIGGIIICSSEFNRHIKLAHENYEFYDNYRSKAANYQQLRLFCAIAGAGLYVYNILDAALCKGARYVEIKRANAPAMQLSFTPMMSSEMAGIGMNLKF